MTQKGLDLIKGFEALRLEAYLCPANVWTIGYGHTQNVHRGQVITEEKAEELLKQDVAYYEQSVGLLVTKPISDNQADALTSFCFNVGVANLKGSTLLKMVNNNPNDPKIREEFKKWRYAKGKVLQGLVRRREAEAELYFSV